MGGTFHSIMKNCCALYLVNLPFQSNQCLCATGVGSMATEQYSCSLKRLDAAEVEVCTKCITLVFKS
jgi:hypothetical protein